MATNTLHIRVRSDGTRVVRRGILGVGSAAQQASKEIFYLRRALKTLFAASGVRAIVGMVNEFTTMNNKIRTVVKSEKQLVSTRKKLLAASSESRTSMEAVTQLYTRTTRAAKGLGKSEGELIRFTKSLAKETILSGASNIEAANAIRQLTQGMGPAGLKGEELRSVLEQLPTVAEAIAKQMGVTSGELRKLGSDGEITGKIIIEAFLAAEQSIDARFKKSLVTLPQAMQVLTDQATEFFGQMDEGLGISRSLSNMLLTLASDVGGNLTTAFQIAGAGAVVFMGTLGRAALALSPYIALVVLLREADLMVRKLTGGTSGLGLVFKLVGENFQKLGVYIKEILNDLVKLISTLEEIPSLQEYLDGVALKQAREEPYAQDRIRNDAFEILKQSQAFNDLARSNKSIEKLTVQQLSALEKQGKGIFEEAVPLFNAATEGGKNLQDAAVAIKMFFSREKLTGTARKAREQEAIPKVTRKGGPIVDAFEQALRVASQRFDDRTLRRLEKDTSTFSSSQAGLQYEEKRLAVSAKSIRLQEKIFQITSEMQGALENAGKKGDEFRAVVEGTADALDQIQDRVNSIDPTNIDEYQRTLSELEPVLDKLQKTQALEEGVNFDIQQVESKVKALDTLLEKTKELPPKAAANAKATVESAAATADAAIVASATKAAAFILQAYQPFCYLD